MYVRPQALFESLYEEKTGNVWGEPFEKKPGRFCLVEVDYGVDEAAVAAPDVPSKLASVVQDLVKRIFDVEQMKQALLEFEIDTERMPLGKLTKEHLRVSAVTSLARCRVHRCCDQCVLVTDESSRSDPSRYSVSSRSSFSRAPLRRLRPWCLSNLAGGSTPAPSLWTSLRAAARVLVAHRRRRGAPARSRDCET